MRRRSRLIATAVLAAATVVSGAQADETDPEVPVGEPAAEDRSAGAAPAAELPATDEPAAEPDDDAAPEDAGAGTTADPAPPQAAAPRRGTRLQGMAYLGRNRDVVGATITVQEESDPLALYLTTTDGDGRFRVNDLANGSYRVEVRREGLVPVVKTGVELRYPFRAVVEVAMEPLPEAAYAVLPVDPAAEATRGDRVAIRGVARDLDDTRLGEVSVRIVHVGGQYDPREVTTAADGSFEIGDVPGGFWRFQARRVGYLPIRTALGLAGDTTVRLELVRQPAGLDPSPLDLMPEEVPVPPAGLSGAAPVYGGDRGG